LITKSAVDDDIVVDRAFVFLPAIRCAVRQDGADTDYSKNKGQQDQRQ
jgi:hypothetical protein